MNPLEVRVVCCPATPSPARRDVLRSSITAEEAQQGDRFHYQIDTDRFLVGRGTLRRELGRVLGLAPRDVPLELGRYGKPAVVGGAPHVNVSHSGDVVLIALTAGAPIGVDVEQIDPRFAERTGLDSYFSAREIQELTRLPEDARLNAFFHTWTSREAVMKVLGLGFRLPRDSFDVSVDPRRPPSLVEARTPMVPRGPLSLVSIPVPPGHLAALAILADAGAFRVSVVSDPV